MKAAVLLLPSGGEAAPAAVMLSQVVLAGLATNWVWKAVVGAAIAGALTTGAIVVVRFSGGGEGSWKLMAEDVAESVAFVVGTPPDVLVHRIEVRTLTVPKKS